MVTGGKPSIDFLMRTNKVRIRVYILACGISIHTHTRMKSNRIRC